jgi:hypothetical protein
VFHAAEILVEKTVEIGLRWPTGRRVVGLGDAVVDLFLRGDEAHPIGHHGSEVDLLPFRVVGRGPELVEMRKERVDKSTNLPVPVTRVRPIIYRQDCADRAGVDRLSGCNEIRIIARFKLRWEVQILKS